VDPAPAPVSVVKRIGRFVLDLIELHIPTAAFATLFIAFILQIFNRYFLRPLTWPEEYALIAFIWTALLGGLYAKRMGSHVEFTIVYDMMSPRVRRIMRIAGNVLVIVALVIAIRPSAEYISFMGFKKSNVLRIPMNLAYTPFVVFLVMMTGRLIVDVVRDLRGDTGSEESR
jgi:TRAP-type C4-dicarboxylate transport system permease small subunit